MPTKPSVFRAALLTALTLAALVACGDSTSGPDAQPDPPRAAAIAVSPESATLSSLGETATFTATVTDQYGAAFPATVTWSSSDPDVFSASSFGTVTAVANGSGTLTATFGALSATAQVAVQQSPASLVVTAGDAQEGTAGSPLPEPVVVRVEDAGGSPVPDVPVMFTAAEGHGSADPGSVVHRPRRVGQHIMDPRQRARRPVPHGVGSRRGVRRDRGERRAAGSPFGLGELPNRLQRHLELLHAPDQLPPATPTSLR